MSFDLHGQTDCKQVTSSLFSLYQSHFEVRRNIADGFEERIQAYSTPTPTSRCAAFELSICYTLGFGVRKDDARSSALLEHAGRSHEDLVEKINRVRNLKKKTVGRQGLYRSSLYKGHTKSTTGGRLYERHGILDKAALRIKQEMADVQKVLGDDHYITIILKSTLCKVYDIQKQFEEARKLETQVLNSSSRILGHNHPDTIGSRSNLAMILAEQNQWEKAELLQRQAVTASLSALGIEHNVTMTSMGLLTELLRKQGRWKEAERLGKQVLELSRQSLGMENSDTVRDLEQMSLLNTDQQVWRNQELRAVQVTPTSHTVIGF